MTPTLLILAIITSIFAWRDYKTKNIPNIWILWAYAIIWSAFNISTGIFGPEPMRKAQIFLIFFAVLWCVSLFSFFILKVGGADVKFLPLLAVLAPWELFSVLCVFACVLIIYYFGILASLALFGMLDPDKKLKLPMFPVLAVALWMVVITSI